MTDPEILYSTQIYTQEKWEHTRAKTCMGILITALFTKLKNFEQLTYLSTGE